MACFWRGGTLPARCKAMKQCYSCRRRKNIYRWISRVEEGKVRTYCDSCYRGYPPDDKVVILADKRDARAAHWNEIKSRVTTHEGELLSGKAGRAYQAKWGSKYLGQKLTRPMTRLDVERYEATKS